MSKYIVKSFKLDIEDQLLILEIDGYYMQWIRIKKGVLSIKKSQAASVLRNIKIREFFNDVMNILLNSDIKTIEKNGYEYDVKYNHSKFKYSFFNSDNYSFSNLSEGYTDFHSTENIASDIEHFRDELISIFNQYFNLNEVK